MIYERVQADDINEHERTREVSKVGSCGVGPSGKQRTERESGLDWYSEGIFGFCIGHRAASPTRALDRDKKQGGPTLIHTGQKGGKGVYIFILHVWEILYFYSNFYSAYAFTYPYITSQSVAWTIM
jgi:hypothetical protein